MNETTLDTTAVSHLPLRSDVIDHVSTFSVVITAVLGLVIIGGNVVTLLAIKLTPSFRSAPDLYLASLAVADLLVGLTTYLKLILQFGFSEKTHFKMEGNVGQYVCLGFISFGTTAFMSSVSSLALLALDRCLSISYPLVYNSHAIKRRTRFIILGAWLSCVMYGLLPLTVNRYSPHRRCSTFTQLKTWYVRYLSTGLTLSSVTVSLLCYCKIGWVYHTYQKSVYAGRVTSVREQTSSQQMDSTVKDSSDGRGDRSKTASKYGGLLSPETYTKSSNHSKLDKSYKHEDHLVSSDDHCHCVLLEIHSKVKRNFLRRAFERCSRCAANCVERVPRNPSLNNSLMGSGQPVERVPRNPSLNNSLMGSGQPVTRECGDQDQTMGDERVERDKKRTSFCFGEINQKRNAASDVFQDNFIANVRVHSTETRNNKSGRRNLSPPVEKRCHSMIVVDESEEQNCDKTMALLDTNPPCFHGNIQRFDSQNRRLSYDSWDPMANISKPRWNFSAFISTASDNTLNSTRDTHLRKNVFSKMSRPSSDPSTLRGKTTSLTRARKSPSPVCSLAQGIQVRRLRSSGSPSSHLASCSQRRHVTLTNATVEKGGTPPRKPGSCQDVFRGQVESTLSNCLRHSQPDQVYIMNNCLDQRCTQSVSLSSHVLILPPPSAPTDSCLETHVTPSAQADSCFDTTVGPSAPTDSCHQIHVTPSAQADSCLDTPVAPSAHTDICLQTHVTPSAQADSCFDTTVGSSAPTDSCLQTHVTPSAQADSCLDTPVAPSAPKGNCLYTFLHHSNSSISHTAETNRIDNIAPGLLEPALSNNTRRLRNVFSKDVKAIAQGHLEPVQIAFDYSTKPTPPLPSPNQAVTYLKTTPQLPSPNQAVTYLKTTPQLPSPNQDVTYLKIDSMDFHENFALVRSEPKVNRQVLAKAMSHNSTRLIKMIFLTQVVFVVCILPSMLVFILNDLTYISQWMMQAAGFLAFINSGVNVFIYVIYNIKYRKAILAVLRCTC